MTRPTPASETPAGRGQPRVDIRRRDILGNVNHQHYVDAAQPQLRGRPNASSSKPSPGRSTINYAEMQTPTPEAPLPAYLHFPARPSDTPNATGRRYTLERLIAVTSL
jgi:hypothetical protein